MFFLLVSLLIKVAIYLLRIFINKGVFTVGRTKSEREVLNVKKDKRNWLIERKEEQ